MSSGLVFKFLTFFLWVGSLRRALVSESVPDQLEPVDLGEAQVSEDKRLVSPAVFGVDLQDPLLDKKLIKSTCFPFITVLVLAEYWCVLN